MNPHLHPQVTGTEAAVPLAVACAVAALYLIMALRAHRDPRRWNLWRTASFLVGIALAAAAFASASPLPPGDFRSHMLQHLMIGMYAPLALVLGAPVTLVLRSVPVPAGRVIGRALHSRLMALLSHPIVGLLLAVGGMAVLYFSPLYTATLTSPLLHHAVHAHFLLAGYVFAYAIAGPDPAPHRPSVPFRLVVLGIAIAAHASLAQLIYAGALVQVEAPAVQLRGAADLMYYGGDIAELLLAVAMVSTWRPLRAAGPARRPAGATAPASPSR
ncbi:cytochrome c oxidase assembly protein [Microbacterium sp. DT81.1]|uniref:cytochrome c oxidase assembly protein n=1 Tax=Microbacterium sp. DT81.1 TaxID=3393413 RepID=UPI003CEC0ECA